MIDMKREILTGDELDVVTGGKRAVQFPPLSKKISSPADFVPLNQGSLSQKLKGIFQRMQPD